MNHVYIHVCTSIRVTHMHAPARMHAYIYCVCHDRIYSRSMCVSVCAGAFVYSCMMLCLYISVGAHVSRHQT